MKFIANMLMSARLKRAVNWLDKETGNYNELELARLWWQSVLELSSLNNNYNINIEHILLSNKLPFNKRYEMYCFLEDVLAQIMQTTNHDLASLDGADAGLSNDEIEHAKSLILRVRQSLRLLIVMVGASINTETENAAESIWNKIDTAWHKYGEQVAKEWYRINASQVIEFYGQSYLENFYHDKINKADELKPWFFEYEKKATNF